MINNKKTSLFFLAITALGSVSTASVLSADVISDNVAPDIQEPAGTYDANTPTLINMSVRTVIGAGACVPDSYDGCTLNDVLNDVDRFDDFKPEIKVHMTADNYPDDGLVSNAEMRQRGGESRSGAQKSFRIKLDKNIPSPLWRGERRLQLLKSSFDPSRVRNKLSYDLFSEIPHLPSMRTQFVHLDVTDQGVTEDYGLYTQVEYFGKEYLERRGWDDDSRVYKVEELSYYYYDDPAFDLDAEGKLVNPDDFEKSLEVKRGKTHVEVVDMLKDLNDPSIDFNTQIMGKYFNIDNYLTWFSVNLLVNNQDSHFHNYYLYNPKGKDDFYLAPWDYDSVLGMVPDTPEITVDRLPRWWFSHANFWEILLHKRFLSEPGNLALLNSAIAEIKNKYFTPEKIQAKRDAYYDIVFPHVTSSPDADYLELQGNTDPERIAEYNQIFNKLSNQVEIQHARFLERLNDPMTFKMRDPVFQNNHNIVFNWDESVSLTGQTIVYDLDIATTKEIQAGTIIESIKNISSLSHTLHWTHPKGTYYYRVTARDSANPQQHWQVPLNGDLLYDNGWLEIQGVASIYISEDGDTTNPPPPPPSGSISNPVNSLAVDGDNSDWNGLALFTNDPDDIANSGSNVIDWQNAGMAHSDQNLYVLYRNRGSIDTGSSSGSYIPWGWQMLMDTDSNASTGFQVSDVLGIDYLIEGNQILKYTGSGDNWSWQSVGTTTSRYQGNIEEFSLSRSLIGNPQSVRVLLQGANEAFGGDTLDVYPDGAFNAQSSSRYFSYSFGTVTPPSNHAPVASSQSVSVISNSTQSINLNATDADGDSLSLVVTQQPSHGTLAGSSLFVQYTPDQNYTGTDTFRYRVNDGTVNSNTATVTVNIIEDNPGNAISNPVVSGGITVNGIRSDWNSLTLFTGDPNDVGSGATNRINWLQAGIAHSNDTVYLMYQNRGQINPDKVTGSTLEWGWQTYLDTDGNANTGYQLNSSTGADYLVEGNNVFRYAGNGTNWNWVNLGGATVRYNNTVAELSFPRSLLGSHSAIKVAFLGNNEAHGGSSIDNYPETGSYEYFFGSGTFGTNTPVANGQRGLLESPESHQPELSSSSSDDEDVASSGGGGSVSWLLLLSPFLLLHRRRKIHQVA